MLVDEPRTTNHEQMRVTVHSAELQAALRALSNLGRDASPVLRSMGTTLKSITEGNFNSVGARYRPAPWKKKRDGKASNLQQSTTLAKSFALAVTPTKATLSNPTVYAAIHQFGGEIVAKNSPLLRFRSGGRWWSKKKVTIPARPFIPITPDGQLTPEASNLVARAGLRAIQRLAGGS
jgi:phage gpG-like protein